LTHAERPVAALCRVTGNNPMRSLRYRELNKTLGFGEELRGVFRSGRHSWGVFALWRSEDQPPFSAAEEKLVSDLSAPIAESFRRAALLHEATVSLSAQAPGCWSSTVTGCSRRSTTMRRPGSTNSRQHLALRMLVMNLS
jgi:hypothetical protein